MRIFRVSESEANFKFLMETSQEKDEIKTVELTQAVQETEYSHLINKRIIFNSNFGRVKYAGKLQHELESDKINKTDIWLGVEWEDKQHGIQLAAKFD